MRKLMHGSSTLRALSVTSNFSRPTSRAFSLGGTNKNKKKSLYLDSS